MRLQMIMIIIGFKNAGLLGTRITIIFIFFYLSFVKWGARKEKKKLQTYNYKFVGSNTI